jgi:poly(A) polymerase Pap1
MKVIQRELKRGGDITDQIMSGKLSWKELFAKNTFFPKDYKYYLSIIASSTSEETQLIWSGAVESKVRFLCGYLDFHESIAIACPFNKGFERQHKCHTDEEIEKAKTCLEYQVKDSPPETTDSKQQQLNGSETVVDQRVDGKEEKNGTGKVTTVFTSTYYVGLELRAGECLHSKFKYDVLQSTGAPPRLRDITHYLLRCPAADYHRRQISGFITGGRQVQRQMYAMGEIRPGTYGSKCHTYEKVRTPQAVVQTLPN